MNQSHPPRRIGRSILAVFAGMLVVVIPAVLTDAAMQAAGVFPPRADAVWLLPTVYRFVFGIAGCWVAARLAPQRPMLHAMILGGIGMAAGVVGIVYWCCHGPAMGPLWYSIAVFASPLPCAWVGGKLAALRSSTTIAS